VILFFAFFLFFQVFKDSLMRSATSSANPMRYFTRKELKALFELDDPTYSETQVALEGVCRKAKDDVGSYSLYQKPR
jgi:hypothetical protein